MISAPISDTVVSMATPVQDLKWDSTRSGNTNIISGSSGGGSQRITPKATASGVNAWALLTLV